MYGLLLPCVCFPCLPTAAAVSLLDKNQFPPLSISKWSLWCHKSLQFHGAYDDLGGREEASSSSLWSSTWSLVALFSTERPCQEAIRLVGIGHWPSYKYYTAFFRFSLWATSMGSMAIERALCWPSHLMLSLSLNIQSPA